MYHIYSKYWNRQALANSVGPDQTPQNAVSDQGLYGLPLSPAGVSKMDLFKF